MLFRSHERLWVGCVDGDEKLDLPTRAAQMSLKRVMRAKITQGRRLILILKFRDVKPVKFTTQITLGSGVMWIDLLE